MEPSVARYAVREVRLENGERFPLLVHGDPLGLPVAEIVEYSITKLRARGPRRASIRHRTEALGLTLQFVGDRLHASDHVTLDQVMLRYFGAQAPFATSGPKKHEFPDAVALLTLESWAEKQACKVLVVSNDPDWVRYCSKSPRLVVIRDLADALSGFQDQTANYAARRLAELLSEGDPVGLQRALLLALEGQDDKFEFDVDADSQFEFESEGVEAHFTDLELPDPEWAAKAFEAVDYGDGKVFVQVAATAVAEVSSYFRFRKWDGIDREYMPMGSGQIITDERIDIEAIVTLGGQIPDRLVIEAVEILQQTHHIELSDIEPDWMGEPDAESE